MPISWSILYSLPNCKPNIIFTRAGLKFVYIIFVFWNITALFVPIKFGFVFIPSATRCFKELFESADILFFINHSPGCFVWEIHNCFIIFIYSISELTKYFLYLCFVRRWLNLPNLPGRHIKEDLRIFNIVPSAREIRSFPIPEPLFKARRAYLHPLPLRQIGRLPIGRFHPAFFLRAVRVRVVGLQDAPAPLRRGMCWRIWTGASR